MKIEQIATCTNGGGYTLATVVHIAQFLWGQSLPNELPPSVGADGVQ